MTAFPMAFPALFDMADSGLFTLLSTPGAVRATLGEIGRHPVMSKLPQDARGSAEVVLAEALNNIVEHAYDHAGGKIELRLHRVRGMLLCDVFDTGAPMPNCEIPTGLAQSVDQTEDLPEGGFGWFLIRALTENLQYRRIGARNHLSFQLNIEQ